MRVLTRWDEQFSTEESNEILSQLALEILRFTPESATRQRVIAGITGRDYRLLCDTDLTYEELSASAAIDLRQCLAFFTKRRDIDIGVDRREAALVKFFEAEQACRESNHIFRSWGRGQFMFRPRIESVLFQAQRKISEVLGDVPSFADVKLRFGPGATTQVKKRNASARQKLSEDFACSAEFVGCLEEALAELPLWSGLSLDGPDSARVTASVHEAKLDFVPKNAKTERGIAVEPALNGMFQLGYGSEIAHRLLRSGIDLTDQTKNQRLAQVGSLTGALATLDLSSASDMISVELVHHLLPVEWALALSQLRTGTANYHGVSIKLQKFSSMGNGFTFPLESLIFYSLAYSCCLEALGRRPKADEISVFGDDIIVPSEVFPLLSESLVACGFTVNTDKSFASGPFRESCGKDYLRGIDIRPCYVKDALDGASIFVLHNFFKRNLQDDLASFLLRFVAPHVQIFGPDGYGDGHLLGEWVAKPIRRKAERPFPAVKHRTYCEGNADGVVPGTYVVPVRDGSRYSGGWSGYTFDTYSFKPRRSFKPLPGDGILPFYIVYASERTRKESELQLPLRNRGYLRTQLRTGYRQLIPDESPSVVSYDMNGRLGVTIPGWRGYRRISIYTLTPNM